jgi:E3 ubiquitin-protein ligase SIAH1
MGNDAPGGERAKEAPPQLLDVQVAANRGLESKPRGAGVIVSFGSRPAVAAASPRPKRLTTVLVVDKARLCCSLCSLALKRPIYQVSDIATQHPTPFLEKLGSCCLHTACD